MTLCKTLAASEQLLKTLKKNTVVSLHDFSQEKDIPTETLEDAVDLLIHEQGYHIQQRQGDTIFLESPASLHQEYPNAPIKIRKNNVRIMVLGHTLLNSTKAQPHIIDRIHQQAITEKIDIILHAGNLTDGTIDYHKVGKSQFDRRKELFIYDPDTLIAHIVKNYPNPPGILKYFISGTADMSWLKAKDNARHVLKEVCEQRKDMFFAGDAGVMFKFGTHSGKKLRMTLQHLATAMWGEAKQRSYRQQNSFTGRTWEFTPDISIFSPDQRMQYFPIQKSLIAQPGALSLQSNFYIDKGIPANLSYLTLDIDVLLFRNYAIERERCMKLIDTTESLKKYFTDIDEEIPYVFINPNLERETIQLPLSEVFQIFQKALHGEKQNLNSSDMSSIMDTLRRIHRMTNVLLARKERTVTVHNLESLAAPGMHTYWDLKNIFPEFKKIAQVIANGGAPNNAP